MKAVFLNLESWTTRIAMALACLMLAIASGLAVFQVITRFVLEQPAEWTEVLIRFSLIWMVFMGIPMAFRQGAMVSVDALYRAVPTHIKRVLDLVVALAALALMLIILWWGYDYAVRGRVQTMAGLESLSMFWAYVAMPVGALFSVIAIVALAALTLMLIILWWGYDYAVRGSVQTMAGLESLSMFWAYIAMPAGAVFAIIAIVANYIDPRRMELETAQ